MNNLQLPFASAYIYASMVNRFERIGSFLRTSCSERLAIAIAEFWEVVGELAHSTALSYPSGMTEKGDKANFRRKCKRNYKVENGILYYRKYSTQPVAVKESWRMCIRSDEDLHLYFMFAHHFIFKSCNHVCEIVCLLGSHWTLGVAK